MNTIILHSQDLKIATHLSTTLDCKFESRSNHFRLYTDKNIELKPLRSEYKVDLNYLPEDFDFSRAALFVSDMDSTLISIECIDEIADFANIKPQVAAITERAMQGELDFNASLIERVELLKGLDVGVLDKVYSERLQVNPGGEELINFFSSRSIKSAVVSGGFTFFTDQLAKDIGLDHSRANTLDVENNKLTGMVKGSIVNSTTKANFVHELCNHYSISANQVIVAGDGANDLEMMEVAGLSVAYHAKPAVLEKANIAISYGGLDKIIDLFDI